MPLTELADGEGGQRPDGLAAGNVWGCYVHGLFDQGAAAAALRDALLARRGLPPGGGAENGWDYAQGQYDALADALRQALDMEKIYEILDRRDSR